MLDASALICLVRRERGWEKVASFGVNSLLSAVNFVEVVYRLRKHGMLMEAVEAAISPLVGRVVAFDEQHALHTAAIHGQSRTDGLSLADCACLALGVSEKAVLVTADRDGKTLELDVKIVQIR